MPVTHTIEVLHADAREFPLDRMREFQALICDPPYSAHVHANITSAGTLGAGSRGYHRQELSFGSLTEDLLVVIGRACARVQGWAILYSDIESAGRLREACADAHAEYVRAILREECDDMPEGYSGVLPWERWSQPQKSGDRPPQGCELLSLFWGRAGSRKAWNGPGNLTCVRHKSLRGEDKHRTEKPLDQLLDLVSWFSNAPHLPWGMHDTFKDSTANAAAMHTIPAAALPGGRIARAKPAQAGALNVLDLCAGSGTTAVACALLGRSCVATELDEEWAARAAARAEGALRGVLSERDRAKAEAWCLAAMAEAQAAPEPKAPDGSDVLTWERAQRRLADALFVGERLA